MDLAGSYSEGATALKSDGTLWKFSRRAGSGQIGSDSDWKKVVAGRSFFLALKQNGTMWGWGYNDSGTLPDHRDKKGDTIAFPDPVQLWPDADWVDVFALAQPMAVKRDGSCWTWGYDGTPGNGRITNYSVYHRLVRADIEGTNWSSLTGDDWLTMGVRNDGTLWASTRHRGYSHPATARNIFGSPIPQGNEAKPVRIGTKSDWVGVAEGVFQIMALEADGTFWAVYRGSFQSKRPSRYHDWLAVSAASFETWALAKDGTISCWGDFFQLVPDFFARGPYDGEKTQLFYLRPSRRPLASINLLDAK